MDLAENTAAAVAIVAKFRPKLAEICSEYDLSLRTPKKVKTDRSEDSPWITVLKVEGHEEEYRVGLSVSLSIYKPGVYLWSLVDHLEGGHWQQHIRDGVPVSELEKELGELLEAFAGFLKVNEGVDPIECARLRMGTKYYWRYDNDDGVPESTADLPGGWTGVVVGDSGCEDAMLQDEKGCDVWEFTSGGERDELKKMVEAEFARLQAAGLAPQD